MVGGYNASLHGNFARNFAKRFPGVEVDDFKRTMWLPRELGKGYYYALEAAEEMLGFDAGWGGVKQSGFRKEMETANLNLSLVEAQVVSLLSCFFFLFFFVFFVFCFLFFFKKKHSPPQLKTDFLTNKKRMGLTQPLHTHSDNCTGIQLCHLLRWKLFFLNK